MNTFEQILGYCKQRITHFLIQSVTVKAFVKSRKELIFHNYFGNLLQELFCLF